MIDPAKLRITVGDDGSPNDRKGHMVLTATLAQGSGGDVVEALILDLPEDDAYLASLVARMEAHVADPNATPVISGESPEDRAEKLQLASVLQSQQAAKELRKAQQEAAQNAARAGK